MIRTHCEKGNAIQLILLKILAIKFSKISTISPAIKGWWIGEAWGILRAHQTTLPKNPLPKYTVRVAGVREYPSGFPCLPPTRLCGKCMISPKRKLVISPEVFVGFLFYFQGPLATLPCTICRIFR